MATVAVIGEGHRVRGYTLAGARVYEAADAPAAIAAWRALPLDVEVVVLTAAAADAVGHEPTLNNRLVVTMP